MSGDWYTNDSLKFKSGTTRYLNLNDIEILDISNDGGKLTARTKSGTVVEVTGEQEVREFLNDIGFNRATLQKGRATEKAVLNRD